MSLDQIYNVLVVIAVFLGVAAFLKLVYAIYVVREKYSNKPGGLFAELATEMFEEEKFEELIDLCNGEILKKPDDPYAYWFLGRVHYSRNEYEKAKKYFSKTVKINPLWKAEWVDPFLQQMEGENENH